MESYGNLVPIYVNEGRELIPGDFPDPCTCIKCARDNICSCRVNKLTCCDFCKCKGLCRNPLYASAQVNQNSTRNNVDKLEIYSLQHLPYP